MVWLVAPADRIAFTAAWQVEIQALKLERSSVRDNREEGGGETDDNKIRKDNSKIW